MWKLQSYPNNSFEWKNVTFLGGQNILWPLQYIFSGRDPQLPQDLRPYERMHCLEWQASRVSERVSVTLPSTH